MNTIGGSDMSPPIGADARLSSAGMNSQDLLDIYSMMVLVRKLDERV